MLMFEEMRRPTERLRRHLNPFILIGFQFVSDVLVDTQYVLNLETLEQITFLLESTALVVRHIVDYVELAWVFETLTDGLDAFEVDLHFELFAVNHQEVVLLLLHELKRTRYHTLQRTHFNPRIFAVTCFSNVV